MCLSPQRRAIFRHLNRQKWSKHLMFCTFWLANVLFATAPGNFSTSERTKVVQTAHVLHILTCKCAFRTAPGNFSTSERTKVVQTPHVLYILTCKCAFRHSRVQFFNIRMYQSGPNTSCFVHFHFRMCFSPQRRAFFWHLNLQKCSEHVMFCTFSLPNVLFATAACNFCFLRGPHDSAPAALTGLLFDWPDTRIIEKTQHFATSLTFRARVSSFF